MNASAPIVRLTTSDQVAQEIRRQIWVGELRGGDRLTQEDIAAAMGVSRIPVREALIELAREGSVRMEPHRGAFVEPLTETGIADHYRLYGQVDGFALRCTVERASSEDRQQLAADMIAIGSITDARTMQASVVAARTRFHALGGSPRFHAVARGLTGLVVGNFFEEVPGATEVAAAHLPAVGACVAAADADGSTAHYGAMLGKHGELVLAALQDRGIVVETGPTVL